MFNRLLKITSTSNEQRWINLDRVTRVSLAVDSAGDPVLAFCFDGSDKVLVHGTDEDSRILIRRIVSTLDNAAEAAGMKRAGFVGAGSLADGAMN